MPSPKRGKALVIVESPGKIKTIAKVLGPGYVVKASVGHVRDLTKSAKDRRKTDLVNGVGKDFTPTYMNLPTRKKVLDELKKAARDADTIYLCPDPDREGEAIAWHLQEALGLTDAKRQKVLRVTFDEITPRGIKAGLDHPRTLDMHLVNAQQARRVLDRIVGYKLSPLLWEAIARGLSAGRVQSVALRLIVEREREIDAFHPEEYWTVGARFLLGKAAFGAELRSLDGLPVVASAEDLSRSQKDGGRAHLKDQAAAAAVVKALAKASWEVLGHESKEETRRPYPPFATSQLQQSAANRLGFGAQRTMRVAQQLYEGVPLGDRGPVALITYMRTDSFRISPDAAVECRDLVSRSFGKEYLPEAPVFYKSRKGAQEAHECIRPTDVALTPEEAKPYLSDEQARLYRLIWERFVASQMLPAIFETSAAEIAARGPGTREAVFRANGRRLRFDGWLRVQEGLAPSSVLEAPEADREKGDEATEEAPGPSPAGTAPAKEPSRDQALPPLKAGDRPALEGLDPETHLTQPPPRYTDASLVKTLEREGIGRPSTYAAIITTLQDRGYAQKAGTGGRGAFQATALGMAVSDRLVEFFDKSIMDLGFTRRMEAELDRIEEEELDWRQVLSELHAPFAKDLKRAAAGMTSVKGKGERSDVPCPVCAGPTEKRLNRFGLFLRCENPECKGRVRLDAKGKVQEVVKPQETGLTCDLCGSPVVRAVGRFGAYLHCARYPEKACLFTMKINKQGHPVRKTAPVPTDKACEKCQGPLLVRVTARGKRGPRPFLSCSRFPKCRFAADLPPELEEKGKEALARWTVDRNKDRKDLAAWQALAPEGEGPSAGPGAG